MLGLRPRLKPRPSLLDLVRRDSIDQISQRPALLESDLPLEVPLPTSPVKETPSEEAPEKVAIVIGMFSFGIIEEILHSMKYSVLSLIVFFAIGMVWLASALQSQKKAVLLATS